MSEWNLSEKMKDSIRKMAFGKPTYTLGWNNAIKRCNELDKEFIRLLKKQSGTTHSCENKKCKCYNENIEDQNCWVIDKEEFDKLAGEELT